MIYRYKVNTEKDLPEVAKSILNDSGQERFFALYGPMGAGKTTLVKALCAELGVGDVVSSPTFAIMNEYLRQDKESVFHFDFYRIKEVSEAYDLGYENFFFSGNYCFVEWPEMVESLLNFPKASIFITFENNHRIIELHTGN